MKRRSLPPFRFDNPRTDEEMLAQLTGHVAKLVLGSKTEKKQDRALKRLEEEELPAALVAINLFAAIATDKLGLEISPP